MSTTASQPVLDAQPRVAVVVEDSPEFQGVIHEAIDTLGQPWVTHAFQSGAEAIDALRWKRSCPDLVLVDLGLPDVSGLEVIRAARQQFPTVPIMVVSVFTSSEAVLEAIQCGARGYLQKGDSALSLSQGIQGVLAGQYPISPSLAHYLFKLVQGDAPAPATDDARLSEREIELLRLLALGYTYEEAAQRMDVTLNTVKTFTKRIYLKLEVTRRSEALAAARESGLLT